MARGKKQADKLAREEEKKVKSTPLTMRQAWEIANKELESLEKAKNEEVKRTKNRKPVLVTPASQGSTQENPLPSEGGADANPATERIEGTLGGGPSDRGGRYLTKGHNGSSNGGRSVTGGESNLADDGEDRRLLRRGEQPLNLRERWALATGKERGLLPHVRLRLWERPEQLFGDVTPRGRGQALGSSHSKEKGKVTELISSTLASPLSFE